MPRDRVLIDKTEKSKTPNKLQRVQNVTPQTNSERLQDPKQDQGQSAGSKAISEVIPLHQVLADDRPRQTASKVG